MRDQEQARLTDDAYAVALRLIAKHRALLDRVAEALLREGDARTARSCSTLFGDVAPESHASEVVGVPQAVADRPDGAPRRHSGGRARQRGPAR